VRETRTLVDKEARPAALLDIERHRATSDPRRNAQQASKHIPISERERERLRERRRRRRTLHSGDDRNEEARPKHDAASEREQRLRARAPDHSQQSQSDELRCCSRAIPSRPINQSITGRDRVSGDNTSINRSINQSINQSINRQSLTQRQRERERER